MEMKLLFVFISYCVCFQAALAGRREAPADEIAHNEAVKLTAGDQDAILFKDAKRLLDAKSATGLFTVPDQFADTLFDYMMPENYRDGYYSPLGVVLSERAVPKKPKRSISLSEADEAKFNIFETLNEPIIMNGRKLPRKLLDKLGFADNTLANSKIHETLYEPFVVNDRRVPKTKRIKRALNLGERLHYRDDTLENFKKLNQPWVVIERAPLIKRTRKDNLLTADEMLAKLKSPLFRRENDYMPLGIVLSEKNVPLIKRRPRSLIVKDNLVTADEMLAKLNSPLFYRDNDYMPLGLILSESKRRRLVPALKGNDLIK